ncbi:MULTISPECIES: response regulator [Paenibacillus]|uniref:response regulator n=1 Tax=Paenibacillus TaxID=44249 RepID=UPI002FDF3DC9
MRVVIVDDEQLALDYLERQIAKITDISADIVGKFTDPLEGKRFLLQNQADVAFLDIHLPEISGIEMAEQILEAKPELAVVFVTAYNEFAVKAFELNALDYIVKPVRLERLSKTLSRVRDSLSLKQPSVAETESAQDLRLNLFRQFSIAAEEGQHLLQWRTTKAQELFLYLLQHRGQLVRKSTLTDLLWPEYELDKVYSQLYTAVYHIRKTLKPYAKYIQITNTTEGYILSLTGVRLDIEEWEERIGKLPPISEVSLEDYIDTMKLYSGDYLQEYGYWWTESECQRLKEQGLGVSFAIAEWYQQQEIWDKAVSCYQRLRSLYPQEERTYFELMKIYASAQNSVLVEQQYKELQYILKEELDVTPSKYITDWYEAWCQAREAVRKV